MTDHHKRSARKFSGVRLELAELLPLVDALPELMAPVALHPPTTPALRAGSSASGVGRRVASPRGFEQLCNSRNGREFRSRWWRERIALVSDFVARAVSEERLGDRAGSRLPLRVA